MSKAPAYHWLIPSLLVAACGEPSLRELDDPGTIESAIVYGDDDRKEYFELDDERVRSRIARSMVVLIDKSQLDAAGAIDPDALPRWGESANLCPSEPYVNQPVMAFCSGVLVDWDLVLTAGHCMRVLALKDIAVTFGYYYTTAGVLPASAGDLFGVEEIVDERLDGVGAEPRLDYAWLRLDRPVSARHEPAAIRMAPPEVGDSLLTVSAGGGLPLKADHGGHVKALRASSLDYFVADADTMLGSSGGAGLDSELALLGILVRGGPDLYETADRCQATEREPNGDAAQEEFTYAARALAGLCAADDGASSLCRKDCGDPCAAAPPGESSGCAVSGEPEPIAPGSLVLALALALSIRAQRRRT